MAFSRKHYVTVADAIARGMNVAVKHSGEAETVRRVAAYIAQQMADEFEDDNPRFDRKRFAAYAALLIGGKDTEAVIERGSRTIPESFADAQS